MLGIQIKQENCVLLERKCYIMPRTRNLYQPNTEKPFRLSRSKIESFMNCTRCFYVDRVDGVSIPGGPPFTLNSAVDNLLKNEFDAYRERSEAHPIMLEYGIDAVPVKHELLDRWRMNFTGVETTLEEYNLTIFGAIDDLWINSNGEYIVVDYKATAKKDDIVALDSKWHEAYKRQMEIYQWLLTKNGLKVSNVGYILYCNGNASEPAFEGKLDFRQTLHSHEGDSSWVYRTIGALYDCLNGKRPEYNKDCDFCVYNMDQQILK
tara:strand:+ start:722 stop:1513 length:792 start_codon:yes stop_codon:yes gene_type:complete